MPCLKKRNELFRHENAENLTYEFCMTKKILLFYFPSKQEPAETKKSYIAANIRNKKLK